MSTKAPDAGFTAEQSKLVEQKLDIVRKTRELQAEVAQMRVRLTTLDQDLMRAGLKNLIIAGW